MVESGYQTAPVAGGGGQRGYFWANRLCHHTPAWIMLCVAMAFLALVPFLPLRRFHALERPVLGPSPWPGPPPGEGGERPHRPPNTVQPRVPAWPRLAAAWAGAIERLDGPSPRLRPVASLRFPATTRA